MSTIGIGAPAARPVGTPSKGLAEKLAAQIAELNRLTDMHAGALRDAHDTESASIAFNNFNHELSQLRGQIDDTLKKLLVEVGAVR